MARLLKHRSFPYVSSTLLATLLSLTATMLVVPMIATTQPSIEQSSTLSHGNRLYRLSPIPAGADWPRS
jgi:hypothetical protein